MLMKQICARAMKYQAHCRFFSSRNNTPLALFNAIADVLRYDKGNFRQIYNTVFIHVEKNHFARLLFSKGTQTTP